MSDTTAAARFSCDACRKTYKWKPELAGRKVKCSCGHVMLAPKAPPAPAAEEDDLIPLADEQPEEQASAPRRSASGMNATMMEDDGSAHTVHGHQVMAATTVGSPAITLPPKAKTPSSKPKPVVVPRAAAAAGSKTTVNRTAPSTPKPKSSRTIAYASGPTAAEKAAAAGEMTNLYFPDKVRDLIVPAALILLSTAMMYFALWKELQGDLLAISVVLAIYVVVGTGVMVAGAFVGAKLLDIGFGAFWTAIFKLCAVALAPAAASLAFDMLPTEELTRTLIGAAVSTALYFFLLMWFFELDFGETMKLVVIFWVIRFAAGFVLAIIIAGLAL